MKTCCFFGHRNTKATPELCDNLRKTVIKLIREDDVNTFLFGSASTFDDLCLKIVNEIKKDYPNIKLIYVRSSFPMISKEYKEYILKSYDQTVMPNGVENAGKASYVKRNQAMIIESDVCVFYYDVNYKPAMRKTTYNLTSSFQLKSGTALAFSFAKRKKKNIINLYS